MIGTVSYQGGLLQSTSARPLASPPDHPSDAGGRPEEKPPDVETPTVRHALSPNEVCQRQWAREIVDRNGSVEEMVSVAIQRVTERHTENRLLEAQAIINELARTGEHSTMLHTHAGADKIRLLLGKES
ncbi:hypothetical protein [Mycolicibacterium helvum]|uniref:Uncharacterized protein n=1 Tax=Mycolicibacterium helvum TaxID=1534349 RepID=A0A7I7TAQ9_9MYCO|nr:hypothetical protein [Mycolicibacterium helvum]BBY65529.1 hypothetical protein MHEL_37720 [Mycolicibacterium helvum]